MKSRAAEGVSKWNNIGVPSLRHRIIQSEMIQTLSLKLQSRWFCEVICSILLCYDINNNINKDGWHADTSCHIVVLWVFVFTHVPSANMGGGFITYNAIFHQGLIKMFCLHFWWPLTSSILDSLQFIQSHGLIGQKNDLQEAEVEAPHAVFFWSLMDTKKSSALWFFNCCWATILENTLPKF